MPSARKNCPRPSRARGRPLNHSHAREIEGKRTSRVYSAPDESILLRVGQTIDGGDVLPGLSLPVARVFAELPPTRKGKRGRSRRTNGTK